VLGPDRVVVRQGRARVDEGLLDRLLDLGVLLERIAPGVAMVRALFEGTDPGANLNPGKIIL